MVLVDWETSNNSIAASSATRAPITTVTYIAVVPAKWRTQGETISHRPTTRLIHSSQTVKAASAAIDSTTMMIPAIIALVDSCPAGYENIHGLANRIMPRMRFPTSHSLVLLHWSIVSSVEQDASAQLSGIRMMSARARHAEFERAGHWRTACFRVPPLGPNFLARYCCERAGIADRRHSPPPTACSRSDHA